MRNVLIGLGVLAAVVLGGAWWITEPKTGHIQRVFAIGDAGRGKAVFDAGGCASCHVSTGQENRLQLGGGMKFATAFGTFYAPNISPSVRDGIGGWSYEMFTNALQAGVAPDGSHYYPAFPYTTFVRMKPQDVSDLFAYIRTLPQVDGKAPPHELAFPFNQRRALGFWKALYLDTTPIVNESSKSAEWNRGRYLVEGLSHCAECHSARTQLGGIDENFRMAGGPNPDGKGRVPNITQETMGKWSKSDIVEVLTTGITPDMDEIAGSMMEVVKNLAQLPKSDREAIAEYIKSLPPKKSPPRT